MSPDYRAEAMRWIREYPDAWMLLVDLARARAKRGQSFGMKALVERARWDAPADLFSPTGTYKLNNNHTSHLARELVTRYPELRPYVHLRRTADEPFTCSLSREGVA